MNELIVKTELAPGRARYFPHDPGPGGVLAFDVKREGDGPSLDNYPSRAEIDGAIARARLERSLEMKRLLWALCRWVRSLPGDASAER